MTKKKTALYDCHKNLSALMTDFAGYEMPLKYSSEISEHLAVRQKCGIFDVSHMGEIFLYGKDALNFAQRLLSNDLENISDNQAIYCGLLNYQGKFIDDVVAYRFSSEKILICVNACNQENDYKWMLKVKNEYFANYQVKIVNESHLWSQIALQGPKAENILAHFCEEDLSNIKRYHFREVNLHTDTVLNKIIIARTGYTGEDGFELFVKNDLAANLYTNLLNYGKDFGLIPCGLICRDTLRLEAGMCLYGNDINESVTPMEAGLFWICKLYKKPLFIGQEALIRQKQVRVKKKLVGLKLIDRGIARAGYKIFANDINEQEIGTITSGTMSPQLKQAIALAYLDESFTHIDQEIFISIRGEMVKAVVVSLPFYKRYLLPTIAKH